MLYPVDVVMELSCDQINNVPLEISKLFVKEVLYFPYLLKSCPLKEISDLYKRLQFLKILGFRDLDLAANDSGMSLWLCAVFVIIYYLVPIVGEEF